MAILPILRYPEPALRQPTRPVPMPADDALRTLVGDMVETMYASAGAGLAAIQVGSDLRLFIVDGQVAGGAETAPPLVFINPEVTPLPDEKQTGDEGCLSFPGVFVPVKRAMKARCTAIDLDGKSFEVEAEGLYARALQHEVDHLNGRLLIDMVGPVKREMIRRKMKRAAETGEYDEAHEDF